VKKTVTGPKNVVDGDVVMIDGDDSEVEYWRDQDNIMLEEEHDKDYNELDEVRK
jgi:hypothetical protein